MRKKSVGDIIGLAGFLLVARWFAITYEFVDVKYVGLVDGLCVMTEQSPVVPKSRSLRAAKSEVSSLFLLAVFTSSIY
jgi:hypothetical protein